MPKNYGVKDRDVAAAWVMERLFDGRLRSGDRLDRKQIAEEVGISRVPVQEMLAQMERDGIVQSKYHHGAYLEPFDADAVRETYEMFGLINGHSAAKAALALTAESELRLRELIERLRATVDNAEFSEVTWQFRRTVNLAGSGPRTKALLSSFATFMPTAYAVILERSSARVRRHYRAEFDALIKGDAAGARRAVEGRCADEAELLIAELTRRGVFTPESRRAAGE
jgi:DNA-binding GntR family transcriptional regulator